MRSLRVAAANMVLDARGLTSNEALPPGEHICLQVTDSGAGMTPEVVAHAFEPFFTTKEVGKGTGLGLSQVYGFVKQSGGDIAIESAPGVGTSVRLYFPRADASGGTAVSTDRRKELAHRGSETVLVVEDDELVRQMTVATLSELGYRVLTAANGPTALEILRREPEIDLLFSNVVMPGGIDGYELIDQARRLRQGLKALMTSGYTNRHPISADALDIPLLPKPYHRTQLAEQIRAALENA